MTEHPSGPLTLCVMSLPSEPLCSGYLTAECAHAAVMSPWLLKVRHHLLANTDNVTRQGQSPQRSQVRHHLLANMDNVTRPPRHLSTSREPSTTSILCTFAHLHATIWHSAIFFAHNHFYSRDPMRSRGCDGSIPIYVHTVSRDPYVIYS